MEQEEHTSEQLKALCIATFGGKRGGGALQLRDKSKEMNGEQEQASPELEYSDVESDSVSDKMVGKDVTISSFEDKDE